MQALDWISSRVEIYRMGKKGSFLANFAPARRQTKHASLNRQLVNQRSVAMPSSSTARCVQVTYPSCSRPRSRSTVEKTEMMGQWERRRIRAFHSQMLLLLMGALLA